MYKYYRPLTEKPCLCCSKIIRTRSGDICENCRKQTKGLSHEEFLELLRQRQPGVYSSPSSSSVAASTSRCRRVCTRKARGCGSLIVRDPHPKLQSIEQGLG
jgi:hypothetical protein